MPPHHYNTACFLLQKQKLEAATLTASGFRCLSLRFAFPWRLAGAGVRTVRGRGPAPRAGCGDGARPALQTKARPRGRNGRPNRRATHHHRLLGPRGAWGWVSPNPPVRLVSCTVPEWRNGRRGGLKIRWSQGRVGSTPSSGTTFSSSLPVISPRKKYSIRKRATPTKREAGSVIGSP